MLTETYIEALLINEELADQVWEAWDKGEIDDRVTWLAWWLIAFRPPNARATTPSSAVKASTLLRRVTLSVHIAL